MKARSPLSRRLGNVRLLEQKYDVLINDTVHAGYVESHLPQRRLKIPKVTVTRIPKVSGVYSSFLPRFFLLLFKLI